MFEKPHEILADLAERKERFIAKFKSGLGNSDEKIRLLLNAIDHPHSRYVILPERAKAKLREEWQDVAKQLGVGKVKCRNRKPKKVSCRSPSKVPIPEKVVDFFGKAELIPPRPYATCNFADGLKRHDWKTAEHMRLVQINPPHIIRWLVFDCDHTDIDKWKMAGLPEPSFITVNPVNGHHHVAYQLRNPVYRAGVARQKPMQFEKHVRERMRVALDADPGYVGLVTKNPLHPDWIVIRSDQMPAYSLAELNIFHNNNGDQSRSHAALRNTVLPDLEKIQIGQRNHALFTYVRVWAYERGDGHTSILEYARKSNLRFSNPLGENEVRAIALSISRFCEKNRNSVAHHSFRSKQAARGRLGGRPRTEAYDKPWEAEGISKATWYRRRKHVGVRQKPSDIVRTRNAYNKATAHNNIWRNTKSCWAKSRKPKTTSKANWLPRWRTTSARRPKNEARGTGSRRTAIAGRHPPTDRTKPRLTGRYRRQCAHDALLAHRPPYSHRSAGQRTRYQGRVPKPSPANMRGACIGSSRTNIKSGQDHTGHPRREG